MSALGTERERWLVIGLGSNVGDRLSYIRDTFVALEALPELAQTRRSSLWETAPVGGPPQGDYLNAALVARSTATARRLLERLHDIERRAGRVRREPNEPRTLDLDLLWIENEVVDEADLQVPHPRLRERAFALTPLVELVADARNPATQEPYQACLRRLGTAGIARHTEQ